MRAARACLVVAWLLAACGPSAPAAHTVSSTPPAATSAAPQVATPEPGTCALAARPLPAETLAAWGSTQPSVWLTPHEAALDVWFPRTDRGPYASARLDRAGALGPSSDVTPFAGLGEADDPVVASDGDLVALAETVYLTQQNADVMLTLGSSRGFRKPIALLAGPELDEDPVVAFGNGVVAVAWKHGAYPSAPDLALAIVTRDGRVLTSAVVERDAQAEGLAMVGVPGGFLLVYTPSSVLDRSRRGLVALAIDTSGRVVSRNVVEKTDALWPVAAWNGHDVGVAFRGEDNGRGVVRFVRVRPDGRATGDSVVVDRHPDPIASFRPTSLVPNDSGGFWLADVASFTASVIVARASEGRVVDIDPHDRVTSTAVVSDRAGATLVRIARSGAGVRGVFVEDRGTKLHAFDIACGAPATAAKPDACAARSSPFPAARFAPFQALAESTAPIDRDVVVGHRPMTQTQYGPTLGNVLISRMSPDGALAWTTDLGPTYHPQLAVARGHVAALIQTGSGKGQSLAILDAARGTLVQNRVLAADAGTGCIAATRTGWLVVSGAPYDAPGKPTAKTISDDAKVLARSDLDEPVQACSLLPTTNGFLLAYTHAGEVSETSFLFVRQLDGSGRPRGAGVRVPDVHFATSPLLARRGATPFLLFGDALGRNLSAVVLDDHGSPRSRAIDVAQTYGLHAALLWGDEIVWATDSGLGRRGCLDALLAPHP